MDKLFKTMHSCCYLSFSIQSNKNSKVITIGGCRKYQITRDVVYERPLTIAQYSGMQSAIHGKKEQGTKCSHPILDVQHMSHGRKKFVDRILKVGKFVFQNSSE